MVREITIHENLLQNFRKYLLEEERSISTVEKYERDVRHFWYYLGGDDRITREKVLSYKKALLEEYKVASANSMLAALNQFLDFVGLPDFKIKRIKVQKAIFREEKKDLSRAEYEALIEQAYGKGKNRLGLIIETICATGIRVSELQYITVKAVKDGRAEIHNKGKIRTILIPEKLRKKLLYYMGKQGILKGSVFVTANGKALDRSNLWREMKSIGAEAGIVLEKIFPHNLRHLFAVLYYQAYKDLIGLADILGHVSIDTTRIYTISTGKEHRERMEKLRLVS